MKIGKSFGFTLFEVLLVLLVLFLLSAIAFPSYVSFVSSSKESALKATLASTRNALDDYYSDHGNFPDSLAALVQQRYLRRMPYDPIEKTFQWNITFQEGVADLHSMSGRQANDLSFYKDW